MSILLQQYNDTCIAYAKKFAKKHDLYFDGWVADYIGQLAIFSTQYFFDLNEIIFDIENKLPKHFILEWHEWYVEQPKSSSSNGKPINLNTYCKLKGIKITYNK